MAYFASYRRPRSLLAASEAPSRRPCPPDTVAPEFCRPAGPLGSAATERWVHEHCARELDPTGTPRPAHDRGVTPAADPTSTGPADPGDTVRVLILGSMSWPRDRAVEVRDAIAAVHPDRHDRADTQARHQALVGVTALLVTPTYGGLGI